MEEEGETGESAETLARGVRREAYVVFCILDSRRCHRPPNTLMPPPHRRIREDGGGEDIDGRAHSVQECVGSA
jgi:hypothetical protein